jgi:hypothetical protein
MDALDAPERPHSSCDGFHQEALARRKAAGGQAAQGNDTNLPAQAPLHVRPQRRAHAICKVAKVTGSLEAQKTGHQKDYVGAAHDGTV